MTGQLPKYNKDWQDLPPIDALLDHDDDDLMDPACALKQDASISFIKDHIDLHSALYHQHVLTTNRPMPPSPKKNPSKISESSSSSKSKLKPMSGTGTITVVTKTTTTTTITGFPGVDVSSRTFDSVAQHSAQQAPSPNNSSSNDSSSSSDDEVDNSDDDLLSIDSRSEDITSHLSPKRQKYRFPCAYKRHESITTTSHSQPVSQSTATAKILKSKSMKKKPIVKKKRTTTSYDAETTAYLKKAFFNYYSKQCKLTREQREAVIRETGLRSRNITYWFSNHKRRLGTELAIYRKLTREHKIKDYDAFVQWRQDQELPAYITREEIRLFKASH
ncbi:Homeodomain-like DNA binding domain-containing transcription factor [Mucor lusitanicus]|uniref:Homeodomain-like DNA binding domain-containing transcription factor n=2 Tax=Mucor circinelloides f. lusitanicus TaxID=29924 RepID=A0A162TE16_MUCCL|nr:Homeodomain-like DNA binding domain-containing transcription factor [Mucor lusitanicus CBS 277.49]